MAPHPIPLPGPADSHLRLCAQSDVWRDSQGSLPSLDRVQSYFLWEGEALHPSLSLHENASFCGGGQSYKKGR